MTTRPDYGRQIAAARAVLRLSMDGLAKHAGLHRQSIFYNERRGRLPRYAHAADRVAEALAPMGVTFETRPDGFAVIYRETGEPA